MDVKSAIFNIMLYAHSHPDKSRNDWQFLKEHLRNTAGLASNLSRSFEAGQWGTVLGWLHDLGKGSAEFQERLRGGRPVDHSTAGAQYAAEHWPGIGKLLAYAVAGHHGGLPDGIGLDGATLGKRLARSIPDWSDGACFAPLNPPSFPDTLQPLPEKPGFRLSFFIRMLFSCLVDADFLDTESFLDPDKTSWRGGWSSLEAMWERLQSALKELQSAARDTPLNRKRSEILAACLAASNLPPGLFSLTVPTGGGKTLSSLAFALRHSLEHGLRRIVYVIPYTSIIEQNAAVFRRVLGNEAVLEHHSNFDSGSDDEEYPDLDKRRVRLAAENWDAPLVVTTNVQFFESLFANRPGKCRKLHNISRSVVILDEVQMLPETLLLPCLSALKELSECYGNSIVLCTATQPALSQSPDFPQGLTKVREIVPEPNRLFQSPEFQRVRFTDLDRLTDEQLAERVSAHAQALVIVNTRKHARALFDLLGGGEGVFHLSALMCPAHRSETLERIRGRLDDGEPCVVVSTQLVEAGVDLDFPVVYRAATGLDSLAQAAGRCNREGKLPQAGELFLFMPEQGLPQGGFTRAFQVAGEVLTRHDDPLHPDAVEDYFRTLFWLAGDRLDKKRILQALNRDWKGGNFPFREVSAAFQLIENAMQPVIIPYDDRARDLIRSLRHAEHLGGIARSLQRYTVQVYPWEFKQLHDAGALEPVREGFAALCDPDAYNQEVGLNIAESGPIDPAKLIT